ncbi:MAG: 50S ribosomal protein L25 [Candidatus Caenarcaniphilales bacterium]|nr:50S ribosomal protein L25 [Candidatus Caenarcaniphilales bacterium]
MSTNTTNINLELKERDLKQNPREARRNGFIPVTVYGKNLKESLSLQITKADFKKLSLSNYKQSLSAVVEGGKRTVLLVMKAIERNPVTEEVLNIQFQSVEPDTKVRVKLPLIFEGSSPLVQAGGTLLINNQSVVLTCPAKSIPASVKFDIGTLANDKSIAYYSDLVVSDEFILESDKEQIIAKVNIPQVAAAA